MEKRHQFRPVALDEVRRIWRSRPMNTALNELLKDLGAFGLRK
jgi:hypothetical protein